MILRGKNQSYVSSKIKSAVHEIGTSNGVEILGPSECPILKSNKYYRWHIILRSNNVREMIRIAKKYKNYFLKDSKVYLEIDTDPLNML
jgi:primosomal protein N' (replication factor Y)